MQGFGKLMFDICVALLSIISIWGLEGQCYQLSEEVKNKLLFPPTDKSCECVKAFTCSSKEMTLGWIFSKVKWYTAFAVASGRFGRCVQKSVRSCLEMTRLTFSLTTVKAKKIVTVWHHFYIQVYHVENSNWERTSHTCFDKGLQGFQLICICKLNSLVQNLSISMAHDTKTHFEYVNTSISSIAYKITK